MNEQRKHQRENLKAFTPVFRLKPRSVLGYIEDLTPSGAMVVGEKSVEANAQITLSIEFSGSLPTVEAPKIVIPARVAWCRKEESTDYFMIGFEFVEVSPQNKEIIEAILRRYKFRRLVPLRHMS